MRAEQRSFVCSRRRGYTLIELMVTISIVGVLAALAVQTFEHATAKAKRLEAYAVLRGIYQNQEAYYAQEGEFAPTFDALGFEIMGGRRISGTILMGGRYQYTLTRPEGPRSFYVSAQGNLDADPWPDVVIIHEKH